MATGLNQVPATGQDPGLGSAKELVAGETDQVRPLFENLRDPGLIPQTRHHGTAAQVLNQRHPQIRQVSGVGLFDKANHLEVAPMDLED